ncbi:MAG TPA: DUF4271 domain-containing protein [Eudoraea sp.]|nr:DUF4271 domain-containing protein [Eudoraea sp.]
MEPIYKNLITADWITITLFSSVLFLVVAKSLFYTRFLNFIILPFNNKYLFMYNKKDKLLNWFHIFFTVFQLLNFSLFLYYAQYIILRTGTTPYPHMYIIILGLWMLFLLTKIFLQLGNGFVFNNNRNISEFIFKKLSYLNYSGLIMFLANVILTYVIKDSQTVLFISIFLIILINAVGWFTILKNHQKYIATHFFYFILYLCALEIAPFVIIANYLKV